MKSLYLRIYLTVVVVLALFAFASGWVFQREIEQERGRNDGMFAERMAAWGDLIERSLPGTQAPAAEQAQALQEWSQRLRLPLALDSPSGERIAASESFVRRQADGAPAPVAVRLDDGRTLWVLRFGPRGIGARVRGSAGPGMGPSPIPFVPREWQRGAGLVALLAILFVAVSLGALPVVRRLTRRLEALKQGVDRFGAGQLQQRVEVSGHDEVAAVAASFNLAATRIEALVRSHQSLLANASHELRSPLARMKMAVSMLDQATPERREGLKREIETNVGELDALVEEILLASRLDAAATEVARDKIDLMALLAEEAARVGATLEGSACVLLGDERLLRRALRNLLENARRYGGGEVLAELVARPGPGGVQVRVCDRGPGVPADMRERIFEPFFRLPGHAEQAGGVGLGLSLVKQIATAQGASVRCEAREGGGSCFVIEFARVGGV